MTDHRSAFTTVWLWPSTYEVVLHADLPDGRPVELEPEELGLSDGLGDRLRSWMAAFMDQGPMWDWDDADARHRFRLEGFRLAAEAQAELGPGVELYYVDRLMPTTRFRG